MPCVLKDNKTMTLFSILNHNAFNLRSTHHHPSNLNHFFRWLFQYKQPHNVWGSHFDVWWGMRFSNSPTLGQGASIMASLFCISKRVFFLLLLAVCFFGFGWPSLKKFSAKKVSFEESIEENKDMKPPAITICARAPAWKSAQHNGMEGHFKS